MKAYPVIFISCFCYLFYACQQAPINKSPFYNILSYGAKGDSLTLNTKAIQNAIDDATKAGGGIVLVPPGKYVTGTIFLKER